MSFSQQYQAYVEMVNSALEKYVPEKNSPQKSLYDAMRYSLMAGGKRLRPVLFLATAQLLEGNPKDVLPFACAIEMIHTYSLIHDDLPCMDNDDYRRGKLTNHKVFGEGIAVLAGDGLLNGAFEIMLSCCTSAGESERLFPRVTAMGLIAKAAGASGMIGGQIIDLESEGKNISPDLLTYMHRCKTGELIKASIMAASALYRTDDNKSECLLEYAESLGLAFQIKDDILDVTCTTEALGKPAGSDEVNHKSTFISLYGIDESVNMLKAITSKAVNSILIFGEKADFLKNLAKYLLERNN